MWVRTEDGTLVNMDHVEYVAAETVGEDEDGEGGFEVRAYPVGQPGTDEDVFYGLRKEPDQAAADGVMDRVFNALRGSERTMDLRRTG